MTKAQVFATIKDANALVDNMANLSFDSEEHKELSEVLYWTLDVLVPEQARMGFSLNLSKRTGHYWVKFF